MDRDYLQGALQTFNGGNWYGWKKKDDNGNKIPNSERMQYQHIKIIKDGATMPTEAEVNAKIQEIKDAEQDAINKKASGKQKLLDLGLTEEEVKALIGV
jgi:hypothetical protein